MAPPVDKKKKEQERIKKQLMVLGFMLVLVVFSNRNRIFGGAGTKTGAPAARAAAGSSSTAVSPSPGGSPMTASPAAGGGTGPAQTPYDIPTLTPEVVTKLRARAAGLPMSEDEVDVRLFADTVDPFTSFATDIDQSVETDKRDFRQPVVQGTTPRQPTGPRLAETPSALKAYHAFGVMILDGEKQAIIKKDGRVVPYHLKEGEHLEPPDDNFRVQITGDNHVWVENLDAPADEKFFELGSGQPKPVSSSAPPTPLTTNAGPAGESPQLFLDESF